MIPIKSSHQRFRVPFVTYAIVGLLMVLGFQTNDADAQASWLAQYALVPAALFAHPLENLRTLVTSVFLHGGWVHLLGNAWCLWLFGRDIEDVLGHWSFALLFVLGGVCGGLTQALADPASTIPMIGASGAIAAAMGAYLVLLPRVRISLLIPVVIFFITRELPAWIVVAGYFFWYLAQGIYGLHTGPSESAVFPLVGGLVAGQLLVRVTSAMQRQPLADAETSVQASAPLPEPALRVVLWSSPRSEALEQPTLLAIAETALAMAIYAWIAWQHGNLHLTIAACIAPFLLLRTAESSRLALDLYDRLKRQDSSAFLWASTLVAWVLWVGLVVALMHYPRVSSLPSLVRIVLALSALPALVAATATLPLKVIATLSVLFVEPFATIQAIPRRWKSLAICTDVAHPPELLPGALSRRIDQRADPLLTPYATLADAVARISREPGQKRSFLVRPVVLPILLTTVVGFSIPALLYRWSIKGTSLVWFPLVWTIKDAPRRTPKRVCSSVFMTFVRDYVSRTILALAAAKFLYSWLHIKLKFVEDWCEGGCSSLSFLQRLAQIGHWPAWQLALITVAALDFALYAYADRIKDDQSDKTGQAILDWGYFLRGLCAVTAIFLVIDALLQNLRAAV